MSEFSTDESKSEEFNEESFVMYRTFEPDKDLEDTEYRQCVQAIFDYGFRNIEPKFDNKFLRMWWQGVKLGIDKARKRKIANRKNGAKGGAPKDNQNAFKRNENEIYFNDNIYKHFSKDFSLTALYNFYHEKQMNLSPEKFFELALQQQVFIKDWRTYYENLNLKERNCTYTTSLSLDVLRIALQSYL